ncbi:3'-5' exonuclease [Modicella reniformis]|uniref:RNA exonuclease 4 n=1 Tax=Modicella reniformis TaxID=1440133 RepID=A0A9P6LXF7_9FUNG|nr:3'-5' exonuclease [Modicella reniformis]
MSTSITTTKDPSSSSSRKRGHTNNKHSEPRKRSKQVTVETVKVVNKVETRTETSSTAAKAAPSSNWKNLQQKINPTPRKTIPTFETTAKRSLKGSSDGKPYQKDDKTTLSTVKTKTLLDGSSSSTSGTKYDTTQLWFDNISKEDLEKAYGKSGKKHEYDPTETGKNKIGKYIGIDCEMVGVGPEGTQSALARVSLVNFHGVQILDLYVRPMERVTDFRTAVSGITPKHYANAVDFKDAQKQVADIIKDKIVVGHAVHNDFKALLFDHPQRLIRDTSTYPPFKALAKGKKPSLKKLASELLGIKIQDGAHSSVEDARTTILLYRKHKEDWDSAIALKARKVALKATRRPSNK